MSKEKIWALVPTKFGAQAKERLAPTLSASLRVRLAESMLLDVLEALTASPRIEQTVVVSANPNALELAGARGAIGLRENEPRGLNPSVEQGLAHCLAHQATSVLIAMGDLPLLQTDDITDTLARLPERGVVLVPSREGTGTNLLASRPPDLFKPGFGVGSLSRHLEQARRRDIEAVVHHNPHAALDIDTPEDLAILKERAMTQPESLTVRILRQLENESAHPI